MIKTYPYGYLCSNIYLVYDNGEGMIVDAGGAPNELLDFVSQNKIEIKYIVLTHGHFDHVCRVRDLMDAFPCAKVVYHADEERVLRDFEANCSLWLGGTAISYNLPHDEVDEGDILKIGSLEFEILHTKGHSPGGICLMCRSEKIILTGDTIFEYGYGRTDLKFGDWHELEKSLSRLYEIRRQGYKIYAGH